MWVTIVRFFWIVLNFFSRRAETERHPEDATILSEGAFEYGSVEKIAFFDASGLYALNRQQEVLNRILFIFSDL